MPTYRFIVKGYVQGVGYRYFVKRNADALGLKGYVRNLPDGSVEVVVNLDKDKLNDFILLLRRGSAFSKVREVMYEEIEPINFDSFEITY